MVVVVIPSFARNVDCFILLPLKKLGGGDDSDKEL